MTNPMEVGLDKAQLDEALVLINQKINDALASIKQANTDDLDTSEEQAESLREFLGARQKILVTWLASVDSGDVDKLKQQQQVTDDFQQRMVDLKQYFAETLVQDKRNDRKLAIYKSLDVTGR